MDQNVGIQIKQEQTVTQQTVVNMQLLACPAADLLACIKAYTYNDPLIEVEAPTIEVPFNSMEAFRDEPEDDRFPYAEEAYYRRTAAAFPKGTILKKSFEEYLHVAETRSLYDELITQMRYLDLCRETRAALRYLIREVDTNGYLPADILERSTCNTDKLGEALAILQEMEPAGVGARCLAECLSLQLKRMNAYTATYEILLNRHIEDLARRRYKAIAQRLGIPVKAVIAHHDMIRSLNPRPGGAFAAKDVNYIFPDVTVSPGEKGWTIQYNRRMLPKIYVANEYRELLSSITQETDTRRYIHASMEKAAWLSGCIDRRAKTICDVCRSIIELQSDFFEGQLAVIAPLKLQTIADRLQVHVSTISRACMGKYMKTPFGIYPFNHFFSQSVGDTKISAANVRSIIREMIAQENPADPYTDQQLCELLKDKNINIARRTVAKYRDQMNIQDRKLRMHPV